MTDELTKLCGSIHLLALLFCGVCLFSTGISVPEVSEFVSEKWAMTGMLVMLMRCAISIHRGETFISCPDRVFRTFVLLGVMEICIAVMQLCGILSSFHRFFCFTGTFRNPSIFAMMMALCMPVCVFYTVKSDNGHRMRWLFLTMSVFGCILLSESRTAMIAAAGSSLVILCYEMPRFRSVMLHRKIILPVVITGMVLMAALYYYKRDSADGRALIWTISLKMIAEKPLLGWGEHGFSASYMPHQAMHLSGHGDTRLAYLADNISHPFNEFLLVTMKYGIVGLAVLLILVALLIGMTLRIRNKYKSLYLGIMLTLTVLSMFNYPYSVPIVWLVSTYIICSVVSSLCIENNKAKLYASLPLLAIIANILIENRRFCEECQWHILQFSSAPAKVVLKEYHGLYNALGTHPDFLYNCGAWMHHNGFYKESLAVLTACTRYYDDYNVELLIADDYKQLGYTEKAVKTFEYANSMVPCRFLPLYYEMQAYEKDDDDNNAYQVAREIQDKPVKIEESSSVRKIKYEAEMLIQRMGIQMSLLPLEFLD